MSPSQSYKEAKERKYMREPLLHIRHSINVDYMEKHLISQNVGHWVKHSDCLGPIPDLQSHRKRVFPR